MESVNSHSVAKFTHHVYPLNPEDHHRFTLNQSWIILTFHKIYSTCPFQFKKRDVKRCYYYSLLFLSKCSRKNLSHRLLFHHSFKSLGQLPFLVYWVFCSVKLLAVALLASLRSHICSCVIEYLVKFFEQLWYAFSFLPFQI